MFEKIFEIFKQPLSGDSIPPGDQFIHRKNEKIQIATCALFIQMAKADEDFSEEERDKIFKIIRERFALSGENIQELFLLSEKTADKSVSIYEFASVINEYFDQEEKFELLKNLWRIIYVDEKLDKYEDSLIKKIGASLNIDHRTIISAKLLIKEEMNK